MPFALLALNRYTSRQSVKIIDYTVYDLLTFCQKLAPCFLVYTSWRAYGSTLFTLTLTVVVFIAFLRLRVNANTGSRHSRSTALLLFSCIFGLQAYVLVGEARWFHATLPSPVDGWRHGFHVAMFVYVVCCIVWVLYRVAERLVWIVRGPEMAQRKASAVHRLRKNMAAWTKELPGFAAKSTVVAFAKPAVSGADSQRQQRVASVSIGQRLRRLSPR